MQVHLAEFEEQDAPRCPAHGFPMLLIEQDPYYKQASWECPVVDCREQRHTGPSEHEILRNESRWWV